MRETPRATYRLQLDRHFTLDRARRVLPYLASLGVDTVYLSPVLSARPGSPHGYDGVDPSRVDRERGGEAGFRRLARAAARRGLRLLLDLVPNHVAADPANPAWRDLLERGAASPFAPLFDIAWDRSPDRSPALVLPWLDRPLDRAFEAGILAFEGGPRRATLRFGATALPASAALRRLRAEAPVRGPEDLNRSWAAVNAGATPEDRARRRACLDALPFRLVPWTEAAAINYRRFFDVSGLVGVRTETPVGFAYVTRWVARASREGWVDALRVDHVDGLADPGTFLRRLRTLLTASAPERSPPYLVVEKILGPGERLPTDWPVEGTTGYDALRWIDVALLPDGAGSAVDRAYRIACPGAPRSYANVAFAAKREVVRASFPAEVARLAELLGRSGDPGEVRKSESAELALGLELVTSALPVYRTYARAGRPTAGDRQRVRAAFRFASRRARRRSERAALRRLRSKWPALAGGHATGPGAEFWVAWQQWSGAVAAKGGEDTAFYRFPRFLGANEVGGDPGRVGESLAAVHAFFGERQARWPGSLTATSTHDSKWGEAARARLIALAEWMGSWGPWCARWPAPLCPASPPLPRRLAYQLLQAFVATAPRRAPFAESFRRRFDAYVVKALREAKERTSWLRVDRGYEARVLAEVDRWFRAPDATEFRAELGAWVRRLDHFGTYYALGQTVLRNAAPGVPDLYQGSEAGNLALVDPDNRRAVSFLRLERRLRASGGAHPSRPPGPAQQVEVTARALRLRAAWPRVFSRGAYLPLLERPPRGASPVLGFARTSGRTWVIALIGRGLADVSGRALRPPTGGRWGARRVPLPPRAPTRWEDALTERRLVTVDRRGRPTLALALAFERWPVALLVGHR